MKKAGCALGIISLSHVGAGTKVSSLSSPWERHLDGFPHGAECSLSRATVVRDQSNYNNTLCMRSSQWERMIFQGGNVTLET
ncbi:hypothetical protein GGS24DRAFT_469380 [Hypoxylon argillaceum]|nr:hypothetical protein GGS24DRAFT_469380 [Hypoxylon argillaceum]KAI1153473.1 hypothetical protein F4825DRAFT_414819 [Nemania diffusa]